jgi:hypothetical protein
MVISEFVSENLTFGTKKFESKNFTRKKNKASSSTTCNNFFATTTVPFFARGAAVPYSASVRKFSRTFGSHSRFRHIKVLRRDTSVWLLRESFFVKHLSIHFASIDVLIVVHVIIHDKIIVIHSSDFAKLRSFWFETLFHTNRNFSLLFLYRILPIPD